MSTYVIEPSDMSGLHAWANHFHTVFSQRGFTVFANNVTEGVCNYMETIDDVVYLHGAIVTYNKP